MNDTIVALSSGAPPAAIAIVRVSGPQALQALAAISGDRPVTPRQATLVTLRSAEGLVLDRCLALAFPGPTSATGEDLVELHLHGGRATVDAVTAALLRIPGVRAANAGEFTRRAFEHGRIDLTEAEGLGDLLAAETEVERRAAMQLAGGLLRRRIEGWRERLLIVSARCEAQIEFEDELAPDDDLALGLDALAQDVASIAARPVTERLRDGYRVLLAGPVNAGKSSLFNMLAGREAAITSPIAGTTRDTIEAPVRIGSAAVVLVDSAGLRESADPIERLGVERARIELERADMVLWFGDDDGPSHTNLVRIAPKSDLRAKANPDAIAISAFTGEGVAGVLDMIERAADSFQGGTELHLNRRQHLAASELSRTLDAAIRETDLVIIAEQLRRGLSILDEIAGRVGVEDMLDRLFGQFCIGK